MISTSVSLSCLASCHFTLPNVHEVIVYENGRSGFLGEHSCMDGTPTLRLNEFILASIASGKADLGPERTGDTGRGLPDPTEIKFVLDDKSRENVKAAEKRFDELVGSHDLNVRMLDIFTCFHAHLTCPQVLQYEGYGKEYIKTFKASPDAWAQLVKQLAFHKMFGRPGVTYESAQTRKYQLGRTEVIRSASSESKAWAEAMLNPDETVR
jgi:carnitine O-acetyltransferase